MTLAVNIAQSGSNNATFRNKIINGAMVVSQYNGTSSVTPSSDGYIIDRYKVENSQASKLTYQQNAGSVTPPVGFSNYLGATVASTVSIGAGDYFLISQFIEGYNVADLNWGTANAKTITLSFQVYSSVTGTFGGALQNSANNRSYPFTYTISSANTWTSISVTIAGDTSGTWLTTNGVGVKVRFSLGTGATYNGTAGSWASASYLSATGGTSIMATASATFYITGVQLEAGTTASPFEYRQYGTELALCQRYFYQMAKGTNVPLGISALTSTTDMRGCLWFPVTMRSAPSLSTASGTGYFRFYNGNYNASFDNIATDLPSTTNWAFGGVSGLSGVAAGQAGIVLTNNSSSSVSFSAEL
jgi:hypothetical protein